ncbi:MAG: hypothetical protein KIT72_08810 [Polyangiaceae bacterium]|nr:hypothetical protein [Polyangiaceae bacterium]MCW5790509.1 hypothetical protein [Polyangiaceae bacterium]
MRVFPVSLHLTGRRALVLGVGPEQARRAQALVEAGADLLVVAERLDPALAPLAAGGQLRHAARRPAPSDLSFAWLAVYVDRDPDERAALFAAAERERVFFCATDQPDASYSHPALAKSGDLTIAIGTGGRAPGLSARLRVELQALLDRSHAARHVARLAALRERTAPHERRQVMEAAVRELSVQGSIHFGAPLEGPARAAEDGAEPETRGAPSQAPTGAVPSNPPKP